LAGDGSKDGTEVNGTPGCTGALVARGNRVVFCKTAQELRATDLEEKILHCLQLATVVSYLNPTQQGCVRVTEMGTVGMAADGRQRTLVRT
jgi:hypothetical protein